MKETREGEIQFCKKTLKPLLEAMSPDISNIRYRHGSMEYGKDFTFSYINHLNQRVNAGFLVKWGDIKGSSKSLIHEIVDQIRVAFGVPYKNKPDDEDLYLNELYVVCSGKFRDNANMIIGKTLERKYNVRFLDGSDIEGLRRKVAIRRTKEKAETRRALNALLIELDQNIETAKLIDSHAEDYIEKKWHFYIRYRLNCLERVLESDIDDKWILDEAVIQWRNLTIQNSILTEITLVFASQKFRKEKMKTLWENAREDISGLGNFRKHVASYVNSLD